MKMLLQGLSVKKLSWDESLPNDINKLWNSFRESLPDLNEIRVPRCVVCRLNVSLQLHIFSDASESAYGACIYMRSVDAHGEVLVRLLTAKSRIAPIKPTTIPRLELCAALSGSRLYEKVRSSLRLDINEVHF